MLSNASRENSGYASGVLAIMRTFGQCLGAAFVGVMMSIYAQNSAVHFSLWMAVVATVLAIILSVSRLRGYKLAKV